MVRWPRKWYGIYEPAEKVCAVYRIRLVDSRNKAYSIDRFLKPDKEGVLSIGCTSDMRRRRREFETGYTDFHGHSEAMLLYLLAKHSDLARKYRRIQLEYQYVSVRSVEQSEREEERLIKRYVREYGEAPPLNSAIPKRDRKNGWQK